MISKVIFWLLSVLGIGILIAGTVFVVVKLQEGPEMVPTHFNAAGEADAYGSKGSLLVPVVMGWILYILLLVVSFFPKIWNKPNGWADTPLKMMVAVLNLILAADFSYMAYCAGEGVSLGVWFLPVVLVAVSLTIIIGLWVSYVRRGQDEA